MIQSMTGFAEKSFHAPKLQAKIGIKSLNHRFFDWSYKGTPIGEIENRLRAACQQKLRRGRIEVTLELFFPDPSSWELSVNEGLLQKMLDSLRRISAKLETPVNFSIDNLFRLPQVIEVKRKDLSANEAASLERWFAFTLEDVAKGRLREGRDTARQLKLHVRNIRAIVRRIEKLAKQHPHNLREKLRQRLKEFNGEKDLTEGRLDEEVAYLAQRYDLAEELMRLKSHCRSILKLLSPRGEGQQSMGKMLDFIAQELYREANTINSKSQDREITQESLAIKGEVEIIRQHSQNLE